MDFLNIKHERDKAFADVERRNKLGARQLQVVEQLSLICGDPPSKPEPGTPEAEVEKIRIDYLEATCDSLDAQIAMAEVELEFNLAVLASQRDLHRNQIVSRMDILLAELAVDLNKIQLDDAKTRTKTCREYVAEARGAPPPATSGSSKGPASPPTDDETVTDDDPGAKKSGDSGPGGKSGG